MEIDGDQLTMRAIDIDGKEFDRHTIVKNPDGSVTDAYRAKARPEEALIASVYMGSGDRGTPLAPKISGIPTPNNKARRRRRSACLRATRKPISCMR